MVEMTAEIKNAHGIHCRPSALIIKEALKYSGEITIVGERGSAKLLSIMDLMALELFAGTKIKIQVSGENEETVCREMAELFETHFDFPSQA
jgi:phosphotransferase system HPr (HPr) family protein